MVQTFHTLGAPLVDVLNGRTLLHHAAACEALKSLAWFCVEKADELPINSLDVKGRSAIFVAARASRYRALQLLIREGANPVYDGPAALERGVEDDECKLLLGAAMPPVCRRTAGTASQRTPSAHRRRTHGTIRSSAGSAARLQPGASPRRRSG